MSFMDLNQSAYGLQSQLANSASAVTSRVNGRLRSIHNCGYIVHPGKPSTAALNHHLDQPPKHIGREQPDRKTTKCDSNYRYVQTRQIDTLLSWLLLGPRNSG